MLQNKKTEVYIENKYYNDSTEIFIVERNMHGLIDAYFEPHVPTIKTVPVAPEGTMPDIKPFLTFKGMYASELLAAFFKELQGKGMKAQDIAAIEGKFEAQSYHLADVRHLLKLPK